ncbi:pyridoxal phosphate-dependent aminotransferase [Leptospira borgpetersenii]|uniref:Aminotransferase n=2 Tax=Leptospira borgpetersenii serovar Hardjo-bovis TaxID=338217 RepID=Q04RR7_LEPBJ|nr:pyridoxal phosphate-dependent aminotransferase [Leptospira borgpetersenii]ABJ76403.1 Aspartate/tyrosine/aromatic aminotransferase [Leptospira borgpetersenii serovar Hardjo-bovis str. JB197]ABJ78891.1 Aspartate/tyrosine/aromatic aminotransferase [Leptospira borgpetersenii serovar Hardjo-bovis str. L550]AMX58168.1 aspartate aminotransferase [Leptospira borgpetersenii serovar Hardjo]AMX61420.1 aspartate aminotransferase [Leptospira borgpetersenii serovar Hardjo]AMX64665.1 aspartate aminotransf
MDLSAKRLNVIEPSPTLVITAKANELKKKGEDIVSFGAGEPDFETPSHIRDAAKKAIDKGVTRYTAVSGTVELKEAIVHKFKRDNGLDYEKNQVIAGTGGKQVIYNYFLATLNTGDEVIIPAPYWVSYADIVRLSEGVPVIVTTTPENNFQITPEQLKKVITPKTKCLILNSPSNPTGAGYSKKDLEVLGEIVLSAGIQVMSDDIYEKIVYDGFTFSNLAMLSPELKKRTFIVNGVSKTYSMTGWRIGYGAGDIGIVKNMETIQSQSTSNPSSISQAAAEAAIAGDQVCVEEMRKAFEARRNLIVSLLNSIPGVKCNRPQGAFYVFPYLTDVYKTPGFEKLKKETSETSLSKIFCSVLLEKYKVAGVPGIAFGEDKALRLSYAMGEADIRRGVERIAEMIRDLSK